jgi:hypothetical protein
MFKKSYLLLLIAAVSICLSTVTANADTIFSDLGSGSNVYDPTSAAGVWGSGIGGGPLTPASQFTAGGTGSMNVTQIDVAVAQRFNDVNFPGTFQVKIWTSSSNLPGAVLYTSPNLTPSAVYDTSAQHPLETISGITGLSLTAGQTYFMSVNVVDRTGDAAWYRNLSQPSPNQTTGLVLDFNGTAWGPSGTPYLPAFDILGSAPVTGVPEPCTMLLLGLSLMGVAGIRKKIGK